MDPEEIISHSAPDLSRLPHLFISLNSNPFLSLNSRLSLVNTLNTRFSLGRLKLEIIKAKAQRKAEQSANTTTNNLVDDDGDLYGPDASKASEELHRVTRERTQTFLNFTNLQSALKASQANKAITRAFNLERDGKINLEKEEEDHVRSLLEDQKELTVEVIKQHEEGVEQELEIIKARLELAQLHTRLILTTFNICIYIGCQGTLI